MADGVAAPVRIIEGGHTGLSRTSHAVAYDAVHDEIVVPNPFAEAILFYKGDASGDAAPIRVIQGPNTLLEENEELALDPVRASQNTPRLKAAVNAFAPFQDIYIDWVSHEAPAPAIPPDGYPFKLEVDASSLPRHKMNLILPHAGRLTLSPNAVTFQKRSGC